MAIRVAIFVLALLLPPAALSAMPIAGPTLTARSATYQILRLEYSDKTSWPPASPQPRLIALRQFGD